MQQKLIFYYSAMKGGKTTRIFQKIHDLEENGQNVIVIKPWTDTKGKTDIINRQGERRPADIVLKPGEDLLEKEHMEKLWSSDHIIVDEAQFLEPEQIERLWAINKRIGIPISCFGLKTNFQSNLFPGSARLFALADEVIELDSNSLCICGEPAKFNARKVNGTFTMEGEEVAIDGEDTRIEYVPLCGACYFEKVYRNRKVEK